MSAIVECRRPPGLLQAHAAAPAVTREMASAMFLIEIDFVISSPVVNEHVSTSDNIQYTRN
jgi:hypothetical protein